MINEKGNALIFNNIQEDNGRLTAISSWTGNGGSNNWGSSADANWQTIDSAGVVVENSIFMAGDFVNFALLNEDYGAKWETINLVLNEDDPNYKITSAGVYFSGGVSYKFSGEGFHTTIDKTTFNPSASSGKLVLGGKVESEEAGGISVADADFWGTVDLTGTTQNSFEGGVEIYDGILKISHEDQLGTTLDKLRLAGTYVPDYYFKAVGKLLIDGDVQFNNQTLTIEHDFFGEIELENGTLKFANNNNRLILDNAAKDSDISNSFIVAATNGTIIFDNSQNDASAIYNHDQGKLSISKALFTGNISGSDASIIKTDTKAQTFISSSRFALNNQLGIHVSDGSLELYDVLFENGTRGAIDADSGSPVSIYASSFINNQRIDKDGGAISSDAYVSLSSLSSSTPEFQYFEGNSTNLSGGAIAATSIYISDVEFLNNKAGKDGGAIALTIPKDGETLSGSIMGVIFEGNEAQEHGGALYINKPGTDVELTSVIFDGNIAHTGKGGAIYYKGDDNGQLLISADHQYSVFKNNYANGKSNSIYLDGGVLNLYSTKEGVLDIQDPLAGVGEVALRGKGTVKLGGENIFKAHSANKNRFTLAHGTLYLYGKEEIKNSHDEYIAAGSIFLNGQKDEFNLGSGAAHTVLIANGGNTISVPDGSINFEKGSNASSSLTLEFTPSADNWISDAEQADYSNAALGLYGAVNFSGSNKVKVKINFSDLDDGFYTLLYSDKSNNFSDEHFAYVEDPEYFYQGKSLSSLGRALVPPLSYNDGNALIFQLGGLYADYHGIATWTGADTDSEYKNIWNHLLAENWATTDSSGANSTIFSNQDFVNFSLKDGEVHQVKIDEGIQTSGIFFSGNATYLFDGEKLNASINETTFYPRTSSGKLVLGRAISSTGSVLSVGDDEFTGIVDMTGLRKGNTFEGGIEIYGGTIKISDGSHIGALDKIKFAGTKDNPAIILIDNNDVNMWQNDTLTVAEGSYLKIAGSNGYTAIYNNKKKGVITNNGVLTLENNKFSNNSAAIYMSGAAIVNNGTLNIHDVVFQGNKTISIRTSGGGYRK
ncbi:hypothetical protein MMG00_02915 [Ignatzschineria rhizosphaerae]|uniref:Autotransporter domain-containing protein n=1 Tax=Ignatzschineria rhizosphaerae TaxID=2923279 RepID=A0ABY3X1V8_9GAMM|nr:hypothetical protein [Ignatzschineria rhizosphaerae]UNM96824.1 hypothetical protein MMG00_02915 [Ignatzschineria rhizosphaerae]